jgi:hypothetical protein
MAVPDVIRLIVCQVDTQHRIDQFEQAARDDRLQHETCPGALGFELEDRVRITGDDDGRDAARTAKHQMDAVVAAETDIGDEQVGWVGVEGDVGRVVAVRLGTREACGLQQVRQARTSRVVVVNDQQSFQHRNHECKAAPKIDELERAFFLLFRRTTASTLQYSDTVGYVPYSETTNLPQRTLRHRSSVFFALR